MYDAVVRHGVDRSRKKHQPLGDDEVFHGVESGAQIVRKAQRQRDPQDPPVGRPDLGCGGRAERSGALKEQQRAESHRTGCAVSQGHSGTGLAAVHPRLPGQEKNRDGHGASLLQKFHKNQLPDPSQGGAVGIQHTAQTPQRQKQRADPQRREYSPVAHPALCQQRGKMP